MDSKPLITGWETTLPPQDTLLRQFVFAYADRTIAMATAIGGRVERTPDASLADLGSPFLYDNAVVLIRPPTPDGLDDVVDRARRFYPRERSWVLLSAWQLPDLSDRGLSLVGHPPLMARTPGGFVPPPPPELRVLPVTTPLDLTVFQRVLCEGYPLSAGQADAISDPRLLGGPVFLFIGYAANAPVAVSGCAVHHGLLELDWVATLPEARGRGYGTALAWRAMRVAPSLPAALIASDSGQPVYERMGFFRVMRLTMWARTTDA